MSLREYQVGIVLSSVFPVCDEKQKGSTSNPVFQLECVRLLCNKPRGEIAKS